MKLVIDVPSSGWRKENLAPRGTGRIEIGRVSDNAVELPHPTKSNFVIVATLRRGPKNLVGGTKIFQDSEGWVNCDSLICYEVAEGENGLEQVSDNYKIRAEVELR